MSAGEVTGTYKGTQTASDPLEVFRYWEVWMALQFIFGNSGSGKSHYLYQKVIEDSMNHPDLNYLVLVPEQFTMQTQKDLCTCLLYTSRCV